MTIKTTLKMMIVCTALLASNPLAMAQSKKSGRSPAMAPSADPIGDLIEQSRYSYPSKGQDEIGDLIDDRSCSYPSTKGDVIGDVECNSRYNLPVGSEDPMGDQIDRSVNRESRRAKPERNYSQDDDSGYVGEPASAPKARGSRAH